eukprot:TRINITY_DN2991_c0_g1_i2.p1 TRINITY_DN2991_c0_g1~~TRINITY_DN2991_c0_g1_i2.p1  ORF type:complete len:129 (+),score=47.79 TRINITY_DN2991_c0_g1_i2:93-479(+)
MDEIKERRASKKKEMMIEEQLLAQKAEEERERALQVEAKATLLKQWAAEGRAAPEERGEVDVVPRVSLFGGRIAPPKDSIFSKEILALREDIVRTLTVPNVHRGYAFSQADMLDLDPLPRLPVENYQN